MKICIIAVGKMKETFWIDALAEYQMRLKPYADVRIIEVADASADQLGKARALSNEAALIKRHISQDSYVVALDIEGKELSSLELSAKFDELANYESRPLTFLIGGSVGLHDELLKNAALRLSFGRITLPHNLARVVLIEQIYRAFKISRGEPYHK